MLQLQVNGQTRQLDNDVDPKTPLLWVLRDHLGLDGAKYGCGFGQCGACTVLLNGQPIRSCTTAVSRADGGTVTSLEGLSALAGLPADAMHPIQQSFVAQQALQCGYCIAGPIIYGYAFVRDNPNATRAQI